MRPDDQADFAVAKLPQSHLFTGCFAVNIDNHRLRVASQLQPFRPVADGFERIVRRFHVNAPLNMHDADLAPVGQSVKAAPRPRRAVREIGGTHQARLFVQQRTDVGMFPAVIARRDDVRPRRKQVAANPRSQPEAVSGVVAVDDNEINAVFPPEIG